MMLMVSYTKTLHLFKKSGVRDCNVIVKVYLSLLNKSKIKYCTVNK